MIEVEQVVFPEVKKVKRKSFMDQRGFFVENYREPLYVKNGIKTQFVQDNHSFSKKGTIRGMHFQRGPGQTKLISVIVGQIYDVFVDMRHDSPTFGKWGSYILDAKNFDQLLIPAGFAHGFAAFEDAHVLYKVSSEFDPKMEMTFHYGDPAIGIEWPITDPILSEKDHLAPPFDEVVD